MPLNAIPANYWIPLLAFIGALAGASITAFTAYKVARLQIQAKEKLEARDWFVQFYIFEGIDKLSVYVNSLVFYRTDLRGGSTIESLAFPVEASYRVAELLQSRSLLLILYGSSHALFHLDAAMPTDAAIPSAELKLIRREIEEMQRELEAIERKSDAERSIQKDAPERKSIHKESTSDLRQSFDRLREKTKELEESVSSDMNVVEDVAKAALEHPMWALMRVIIVLANARNELAGLDVTRKYEVRHIKKNPSIQWLGEKLDKTFEELTARIQAHKVISDEQALEMMEVDARARIEHPKSDA